MYQGVVIRSHLKESLRRKDRKQCRGTVSGLGLTLEGRRQRCGRGLVNGQEPLLVCYPDRLKRDLSTRTGYVNGSSDGPLGW